MFLVRSVQLNGDLGCCNLPCLTGPDSLSNCDRLRLISVPFPERQTNRDPIHYNMFVSPMYLSTLMNNRCRHEALRNTSVRKMVLWHNCRPHCRLGPYFWVIDMRGKMTTPTGKSAKARLTIKALVAERSFLLITTASMTKPFPEESKLWQ